MRIITLVENTTNKNLKAIHGLSFYVETNKHKLLFDLGPDKTIFNNAKKLNIDLKEVDTVVVSHGHYDHGGALKEFLNINNKAKIYIQRKAYEPHFSKVMGLMVNIGIDKNTMNNKNIVLLDGDFKIDDELELFISKKKDRIDSNANKSLYKEDGLDDFVHEQNLLIKENKDVLLMGCAHSGVIAILESMNIKPTYCIGGFHVYSPSAKKTVPQEQLDMLVEELNNYKDVKFYTCHCTGKQAFDYLSNIHDNIKYIACGDELEI